MPIMCENHFTADITGLDLLRESSFNSTRGGGGGGAGDEDIETRSFKF